MMCSMHWMSLKGLGGNMNSRTIGKVARFIVNFCDWMDGYHGYMIAEGIKIFFLSAPAMWLFLWFAIKLS